MERKIGRANKIDFKNKRQSNMTVKNLGQRFPIVNINFLS